MKLRIFKDTAVRAPVTRLVRLCEMVIREETGHAFAGQVNLVFTTDRKIRKLNRDFRGIDRTTDVLSFNLDDPQDKDGTVGEIYICVGASTRQAREYGHSLSAEILRLACHGLLHVLGYDHARAADEKKMKAREDYFLDRLSRGN